MLNTAELERRLSLETNEKMPFTGYALLVARENELLYKKCWGLTHENGCKIDEKSLFDMASCTKIMVTTLLALMAIDEGLMSLYDRPLKPFSQSPEIADITVLELLTHTSGIKSHVLLENYAKNSPAGLKTSEEKAEFDREICEIICSLPLNKKGEPEYSCLGFILLGKYIERLYERPLDELAGIKIFEPLNMKNSCFNPLKLGFEQKRIVATEPNPLTLEHIQGEVHDENARFLGGVSGNAGLFSCLDDVYKYAKALICDKPSIISKRLLELAVSNYTPGFDMFRGLGFHLAGTELNFSGDIAPKDAFGHTGFTGTSILMSRNTKEIIILLSNRVYHSRNHNAVEFFKERRMLHNIIHSCFFNS